MLMRLSEDERNLVEALVEVGYGELYDVEVLSDDGFTRAEISEAQYALIKWIRESGASHIKKITVHQKDPVSLEVSGETKGFRCTKKIRL